MTVEGHQMHISVIGTGYVGLVTGTCFAEMGNRVTCVDIDAAKVKQMQSGYTPIFEPDLEGLMRRNIKEDRLNFTTELTSVAGASVIFLALPTPPGEDGSADLSYVMDVADKLGPLLRDYTVVVDKSTVPVGTAERVKERIGARTKADFDVVSNPEFLREGLAVTDFLKPDRVVIGTSSDRAKEVMERLYQPFVRQGNPILFMDERSAELTKYTANSFLATKISFMNDIANLCELLGANIDSVRLGIGSDDRIGRRFLFSGIGYGGSCFPKDVMALLHTANEHDYALRILEAVAEVNRAQKSRLIAKLLEHYQGNLEGKCFALWGLAFKPNTDDVREAPALEMVKDLISAGARVVAYDPEAMPNVKRLMADTKGLSFADEEYAALDHADALLIATEWANFRSPDFAEVRRRLAHPVIFDGRNLYDPEQVRQAGFHYVSIGRRVVDGRSASQ